MESQELVRDGRILPEIAAACGRLGHQRQKEYALPLLGDLEAALTWRDEVEANYPPDAASLFNDLFRAIATEQRSELEALGRKRTLVFRGVRLYDDWAKLIALARRVGAEYLHFVSQNDVGFWLRAHEPETDAYRYSEPLRSFNGEKVRIMVLERAVWSADSTKRQAQDAIAAMMKDGFKVAVVWKEDVPEDVRTDFGLIGRFAVSRFLNMHSRTEARTLKERFLPADIRKAEADWEKLMAITSWRSESGNPLLGP